MDKKILFKKKPLFILLLFIFLLLLNIIPSKIAHYFNLPFYLDSIGTVFAAMLCGNPLAVMVGFFYNVINGISNVVTLYCSVISVFIALFAGFFQKKGFFKTPGKAIICNVRLSSTSRNWSKRAT